MQNWEEESKFSTVLGVPRFTRLTQNAVERELANQASAGQEEAADGV